MLSLIKCLLFIFGQFEISFRLRQLRSELPKDQRRRNGGGKNDDLKGVGREGRTRVRQVGHAWGFQLDVFLVSALTPEACNDRNVGAENYSVINDAVGTVGDVVVRLPNREVHQRVELRRRSSFRFKNVSVVVVAFQVFGHVIVDKDNDVTFLRRRRFWRFISVRVHRRSSRRPINLAMRRCSRRWLVRKFGLLVHLGRLEDHPHVVGQAPTSRLCVKVVRIWSRYEEIILSGPEFQPAWRRRERSEGDCKVEPLVRWPTVGDDAWIWRHDGAGLELFPSDAVNDVLLLVRRSRRVILVSWVERAQDVCL